MLRPKPYIEPHWPHAPSHKLGEAGTYFVTASTYHQAHYFRSRERLSVLHRGLLKLCHEFNWQLEAWAVFSNHYHFIAHSPVAEKDAQSLSIMLGVLHRKTATWINEVDSAPGRRIWHNYWETKLTFQRAYLARLNYVHHNPVKHGLVDNAALYPFCSAAWFERTAPLNQVKMIYGMKTDTLNLHDDYNVGTDW